MNLWTIIAPDAPAPGWPGRTRYLAGQLARIVIEAALLLFLVWIFAAYLVVAAPR